MIRPACLAALALCVLSVVIASLPAAPAAATADWPVFRGADRNGKSPDTGLLKEWPADGPPLLWKLDDVGKGYSAVTVAGGMVYVTGDQDGKLIIRCLNAKDGKLVWKKDNGPAWTGSYPGSRSSPTVDMGKLYLLSGVGVLGCYDAKTGNRLWFKDLKKLGGDCGGWGYAESVLVLDNAVICKPGGRAALAAFNKTTGANIWSTSSGAGPEYGSCTYFVHNKVPYIVTGTTEGLICVAARSGNVVWKDNFSAHNTANCPTPVYSDGYVFWANGYGKGGVCMKLDASGKATRAWTTRDMDCHHGGYVIHEGCIYGNNGGGVTCLDLKTGEKKWSNRGVGKGSVAWADGMLYLFSESGGQAALATCSQDGLEIKGKVKVDGDGPSWAHPVIIGGRLYLRYDTNLYCFDVKAK